MREIKFKAFLVESKTMTNSFGIFTMDGNYNIQEKIVIYPEDGDIIMQYTGLKDKNGVEVYEGDILSNEYPYKTFEVGVVEYLEDGFVVNYGNDEICYLGSTKDNREVIGNIYENPELIEVKEDE